MKRIIMTMILGSLLMAGCNPDEIPGTPYNGPDYVYFYTEGSGETSGNVTRGFSSSAAPSASITRKLLAVGIVADYDRTIKLTAEIDPSMEEEYDVSRLIEFEEDTYILKAGEISMEVTFKLLNDGEYLKQHKGKTIVTNVKVANSDDFAVGFEYQTLIYQFWISPSYQ